MSPLSSSFHWVGLVTPRSIISHDEACAKPVRPEVRVVFVASGRSHGRTFNSPWNTPFIRGLAQTGANRIVPHVIPFDRLLLPGSHLRVPTGLLPDGAFLVPGPPPRHSRFPEMHPSCQRRVVQAGGRTEKVDVIRHDDISPDEPMIGVNPNILQEIMDVGASQDRFFLLVQTVRKMIAAPSAGSRAGTCTGVFRSTRSSIIVGGTRSVASALFVVFRLSVSLRRVQFRPRRAWPSDLCQTHGMPSVQPRASYDLFREDVNQSMHWLGARLACSLCRKMCECLAFGYVSFMSSEDALCRVRVVRRAPVRASVPLGMVSFRPRRSVASDSRLSLARFASPFD